MRPSSCWNGGTSALQPEKITSKGTSEGNLFNDPRIVKRLVTYIVCYISIKYWYTLRDRETFLM